MKALAFIVGVSSFAISSLAFGQDASRATDSPANEQSAASLDDIVVTAQRREQRLQEVPLSVTALSSEALEQSGVESIFDLQTAVSGLSYGGAGNHTQPSIRGVSASVSVGGAENSNSLYVDGVFYSQAQLLGANLPDVERVEVLKGPQGTLFGRNSVGGAIRIFTRNPTFTPTADLSVETGLYTGGNGSREAPHYTARGFFGTPLIDDKLAVSLSAGYDWTDGWLTEDVSGDRYGKVERVNARSKLLFEPNDAFRILLNAYYLQHDDRGVQAMTPVNGLVSATVYPGSIVSTERYHTAFDVGAGVDWDTADVQSRGISAQAEWKSDLGVLTSITSYNEDEVYNRATIHQSRGTAQCLLAFACVHLNRPVWNDAFLQELTFTSRQLDRYRFTAGLFYFDQLNALHTTANDAVFPGGIPNSFVEHNLMSIAGYGELEIEATSRLAFVIGGRYTYEEREDHLSAPAVVDRDEIFRTFLPRVSVRYALSPTTNIYATYSKGEASGLTGVTNPGSVPPYQEVQPEENTAYEIGLKYASPNASFNLAAFYYDYKNKQEQGWTGTAVIHQNTGAVRIYGIDADASYRFSDAFTVRGNVTWLPEAEYRDFPDAVAFTTNRTATGTFQRIIFDATGRRLPRSPEFTGNVTAAYDKETDSGAWDASTTLSYSSNVYHDIYQVVEQDAYVTISARAGYTFNDPSVRIGLYGRNLTNEAYIHHAFASGIGFTANYAKPREIGLSLSYAF